jgi:hypothetical protein
LGIGIGSKVGTTPGGVGTGFFVGGLNTIGMNKVGSGVTGFFVGVVKTIGINNVGSLVTGLLVTGLLVGFLVTGLSVGFLVKGLIVGFLVVGLEIGLSTGPTFGGGKAKVAWRIISMQSKVVLRNSDMILRYVEEDCDLMKLKLSSRFRNFRELRDNNFWQTRVNFKKRIF